MSMTVKTLVALLQSQPEDAPVFIYVDGTRMEISNVDDSFAADPFAYIDLNADIESD